MWTRAQLKEKAKYALKVNYWKVVAVAFLMTIIIGGLASGYSYNYTSSDISDYEESYDDDDYSDDYDDLYNELYGDMYDDIYDDSYDDMMDEEIAAVTLLVVMCVVLIIIMIVMVIALVISLLWSGFIANPVMVGANRFFYKSLNEKAEVKELLFSFDSNFKNIAKVMFFKTLYQMLWTFLFIIPGIVKSYEYRMIPYLMGENPNLTKEQAFALSKQMMDGQKWDAFVLDMSFLGWEILSGFTGGILGYFYVTPYRYLTEAALYEELSLKNGRPAAMEPVIPEYQTVWEQQAATEVVENDNIGE